MSSSGTTPEGAPTEAPPPARGFDTGLRRPRARFLVIGLVVAAALGVGLFTSYGSNATAGRPGVGDAAPTFSLPALSGHGRVGIPADGGGQGRPAVVLFYASDCVPCQKEIPALAAAYRHQTSGRVAIIGVAAADPAPRAFARASHITFPVGLDTDLGVTEGAYYFSALPEAVFVTGSGTIAAIHYGALSTAQLAAGERKYFTS